MKVIGLLLLLITTAQADPIIGHYPGGSPYARQEVSNAVRSAIAPAGVRLGYVGDFLDMDYDLSPIRWSLDAVWGAGGVYVLNLMTTTPLRPIAYPQTSQEWDRSNRFYALAAVIKSWGDTCGPTCYLLIIPYPEMNGNWVPYGQTPGDFVEAFRKLRYVLWQTGALPYVRLVWGPMAASVSDLTPYYPGAGWADIVGCSAYQDLAIVTTCFTTLRTIAKGVPMLLTQTGACAVGNKVWASQLVDLLIPQTDVLGFLWFDYDKECDWRLSPQKWRAVVQPLDPR